MKKWKNDRGELLVEVLAAILVATLSVALLFGCIMTSSQMGGGDRDLDEEHYKVLSEAEAPSPEAVCTPGTVTIKNDKGGEAAPFIQVYGDEGMYSYKRKSP